MIETLDNKIFPRSEYPEILEEKSSDAIVILSGGIVQRARLGHEYYSTTSYRDFGLGGKARVHAGAFLAHTYPDLPIVALSRGDPTFPTHASVIAQELHRHQIEHSRIIQDDEPYNTITEVISTINLSEKYGWKNVTIVSNDYHKDRIMMIKKLIEDLDINSQLTFQAKEYLKLEHPHFNFTPAEDILSPLSPHYEKLIYAWKQTSEYKERVLSEKRGVEALLNNSYVIKKREK